MRSEWPGQLLCLIVSLSLHAVAGSGVARLARDRAIPTEMTTHVELVQVPPLETPPPTSTPLAAPDSTRAGETVSTASTASTHPTGIAGQPTPAADGPPTGDPPPPTPTPRPPPVAGLVEEEIPRLPDQSNPLAIYEATSSLHDAKAPEASLPGPRSGTQDPDGARRGLELQGKEMRGNNQPDAPPGGRSPVIRPNSSMSSAARRDLTEGRGPVRPPVPLPSSEDPEQRPTARGVLTGAAPEPADRLERPSTQPERGEKVQVAPSPAPVATAKVSPDRKKPPPPGSARPARSARGSTPSSPAPPENAEADTQLPPDAKGTLTLGPPESGVRPASASSPAGARPYAERLRSDVERLLREREQKLLATLPPQPAPEEAVASLSLIPPEVPPPHPTAAEAGEHPADLQPVDEDPPSGEASRTSPLQGPPAPGIFPSQGSPEGVLTRRPDSSGAPVPPGTPSSSPSSPRKQGPGGEDPLGVGLPDVPRPGSDALASGNTGGAPRASESFIDLDLDVREGHYIEYARAFQRRLREEFEHDDYGPKASEGLRGKVVLQIRVKQDGTLAEGGPVVLSGGDRSVLCDLARKAVTNAAPYPKIPPKYERESFLVKVTFQFRETGISVP